jgi:hypothetical protein
MAHGPIPDKPNHQRLRRQWSEIKAGLPGIGLRGTASKRLLGRLGAARDGSSTQTATPAACGPENSFRAVSAVTWRPHPRQASSIDPSRILDRSVEGSRARSALHLHRVRPTRSDLAGALPCPVSAYWGGKVVGNDHSRHCLRDPDRLPHWHPAGRGYVRWRFGTRQASDGVGRLGCQARRALSTYRS